MKTIIIQVCCSDGTPHGHGGFELDPEEWEVTESQYKQISKFVNEGEHDLIAMRVRGLIKRCKEVVEEQEYFAELRGEDMDYFCVHIYVVDLDPEEE